MAGQKAVCVQAFEKENKLLAEQLLPEIQEPGAITTTFEFSDHPVASVSLLHLAALWGWKNVVIDLVSVYKCIANCKDEDEHIPLHYAACSGHLEVVKHFVVELLCDPMDRNKDGYTPLHYACSNGQLDTAQYLIKEANCDPSCDAWTPLHIARIDDQLDIAQYFDRKEPSLEKMFGNTPLSNACRHGKINIVKYLIEEEHCNPLSKDAVGYTAIHIACRAGHLDITEYLIGVAGCDPLCELDNNDDTSLHIACLFSHARIVEYILSTGRVNPLALNKNGKTPFYYASGEYDIIKLFQPFIESSTAFPVHTFTKLILTGDSGAGKTTITELIIRLASSTAVECITDVQRFTVGIVPHHIQSEQLGNFVMYDFAGQQEYYSSHAAVLEQVMQRSAAMFLCVVDLSETKERVCESLHYWLSFIDNACSTTEGKSHVLIVGSHADQVMSSVEEKSSLLRNIIKTRGKEHVECIAMDCRRANTDASCHLITTLTNSQKAITASQPVISYYAHIVYAFLCTKLDKVGCILPDLISELAKEDNIFPDDQSVLVEILTILSDKGLILFLHNDRLSWIVVKTEILLHEINGILFAPDYFKEHYDLASNTGIVPVSNLHKVFPNYNSEMLVGFLTSLDFCRPVDPSVLQYTNLQTTPSHSTADLLFFPGLVQSERPDSLVQQRALKFGWCLKCIDPHEFFSSRFLHLLLLSVAYKFPLASQAASSSVSGLQRICTVWRNGIFWRNLDNIITVIELTDKNRCVFVAMSCDDTSTVEHAELRSSLIGLVRHLQQQYCSRLNVREFLVSPDLIQRYPLDNLPDSKLFDIHSVARSMLLHKKGVPSYKDASGYLTVKELPFEPYHQLSSFSVCQLLNLDMTDQTAAVLDPLLQEVKELGCQLKRSLNVSELREHLDKLSLFVGKNPLVSSFSCTIACDSSNVSLVCTGGGWVKDGGPTK